MVVSEEFCGGTLVAKRGAGGRGRRGLPPYWEDGVPGGGRDQSEEPRVGVSGLMDEARSGEIFRGLAVGRGMVGVWPRLEPGLEAGLELWTVEAAGLK
jgi:hypothetical protein